MAKFRPGDLVRIKNNDPIARYGVVADAWDDHIYAHWLRSSGAWSDGTTWRLTSELELVEDDDALAAFTAWRLTNG